VVFLAGLECSESVRCCWCGKSRNYFWCVGALDLLFRSWVWKCPVFLSHFKKELFYFLYIGSLSYFLGDKQSILPF
jgi:hypothetical protein